MRITSVFFDLDGTLVDSLPGILHSVKCALSDVCPGREVPDLRPFIGPPVREVFRRALRESDEDVLLALERAFRKSYDAEGCLMSVCYPGIVDLLSELVRRDYICRVITNKPSFATHGILAHLRLAELMAEVITPDCRTPVYTSKAEAAVDARRRLNLDPASAVLVGDSLDDAVAAAACGMEFIAAGYGYGGVHQSGHESIRYCLSQASELLSVLDSFR